MSTIQQCPDFNPEFVESYLMNGRSFIVKVQYRGVEPGDVYDMQPQNVWAFEIYYKDELTVAGPFRHSVEDRLAIEYVGNSLATFFGEGDLDALLEQTRRERQKDELTIDQIVEKCVKHMFAALVPEGLAHQDYDILLKSLSPAGWTVILTANAFPAHLYLFDFKNGDRRPSVETYVKAYVAHFEI